MPTPSDMGGGSARTDYQGRVDASTRQMLRKQQQVVEAQQQDAMTVMLNAERAARVYGDTQEAQARIAADNAMGDRVDGLGQSTAAALNAEAKARSDTDALRAMVFDAAGPVVAPKVFLGTGTVKDGAVVFNMASAGFSTISAVDVRKNDVTTLYTFGWAISADRKTLTVTARRSATPALSILGINILAAPAVAPNGTSVQVIVFGA